MSVRKPVRVRVCRFYNVEEATSTRATDTIYTSTAVPPPTRSNHKVKKVCDISWDTEIDISSLPTFTNRLGKVIYKLEYQVEMTCVGGSVDFAIYYNDRRQGSKHVVVDYEARS